MFLPDLKWAAGLFEGEGSITILTPKYGRKQVQLAVSSTDLDVLKRFWAIVGVGHISGPKFQISKHTGRRQKAQYSWRVTSFEGSQAVLAAFYSELGQRRQARVLEALKAVQ